MILNSSKLFYRNKNCSVTYYQSLYEVSWGWKNLDNDKNFEKFEKNSSFIQQLLKIVMFKC